MSADTSIAVRRCQCYCLTVVLCLQDVLVSQNGRQFVDFARFHETLPIDEPPPQALHGMHRSGTCVSIMHLLSFSGFTHLHMQSEGTFTDSTCCINLAQELEHNVQQGRLLTLGLPLPVQAMCRRLQRRPDHGPGRQIRQRCSMQTSWGTSTSLQKQVPDLSLFC